MPAARDVAHDPSRDYVDVGAAQVTAHDAAFAHDDGRPRLDVALDGAVDAEAAVSRQIAREP